MSGTLFQQEIVLTLFQQEIVQRCRIWSYRSQQGLFCENFVESIFCKFSMILDPGRTIEDDITDLPSVSTSCYNIVTASVNWWQLLMTCLIISDNCCQLILYNTDLHTIATRGKCQNCQSIKTSISPSVNSFLGGIISLTFLWKRSHLEQQVANLQFSCIFCIISWKPTLKIFLWLSGKALFDSFIVFMTLCWDLRL